MAKYDNVKVLRIHYIERPQQGFGWIGVHHQAVVLILEGNYPSLFVEFGEDGFNIRLSHNCSSLFSGFKRKKNKYSGDKVYGFRQIIVNWGSKYTMTGNNCTKFAKAMYNWAG
eukprot:346217_1